MRSPAPARLMSRGSSLRWPRPGRARGLSARSPSTIALETVLGTAWMAATTGESMERWSRRVASPNGTTEAGLAVLDDKALDDLVGVTIDAAARRGAELADEARPRRS